MYTQRVIFVNFINTALRSITASYGLSQTSRSMNLSLCVCVCVCVWRVRRLLSLCAAWLICGQRAPWGQWNVQSRPCRSFRQDLAWWFFNLPVCLLADVKTYARWCHQLTGVFHRSAWSRLRQTAGISQYRILSQILQLLLISIDRNTAGSPPQWE